MKCLLVKREAIEKIDILSRLFNSAIMKENMITLGKLSNSVEKDMDKSREKFSSILRGEKE